MLDAPCLQYRKKALLEAVAVPARYCIEGQECGEVESRRESHV